MIRDGFAPTLCQNIKADFKPGREGTLLKSNHHPQNVEEPCLIRVSILSYQIAQRQVPVHQSNTSVLVQVSQAPWHQAGTIKQSTSTSKY